MNFTSIGVYMNFIYALTCLCICAYVVSHIYATHLRTYHSPFDEEETEEDKVKRRKRELVQRITYLAKDIVRDSKYTMAYPDAYKKAEEMVLEENKIMFQPISSDLKEIAKLPIPRQPVQ